MNSVIVDTCIITNMNGYIRIMPIKWAPKYNIEPVTLHTITLGSKRLDNKLIASIADGQVSFHDLLIM